jgi:hypothetical protein
MQRATLVRDEPTEQRAYPRTRAAVGDHHRSPTSDRLRDACVVHRVHGWPPPRVVLPHVPSPAETLLFRVDDPDPSTRVREWCVGRGGGEPVQKGALASSRNAEEYDDRVVWIAQLVATGTA